MHIADLVALDIQHETRRHFALLPYQQVLTALQYYASGTFQVIEGDSLHVSQPTACSAIHYISASFSQKINDYVKFPNNIDAQPIKDEGKKEMFYLTMHSTHFIYRYMASDIW